MHTNTLLVHLLLHAAAVFFPARLERATTLLQQDLSSLLAPAALIGFGGHPVAPYCKFGMCYFAVCYSHPFFGYSIALRTMLRWITSLFVLQPHPPQELYTNFEGSLDQTNWPDGSQLRKRVRYHEPDGWSHSNWVWRSNGYVDRPGSLHPKIDKAECRHCLGVLRCSVCDKIIRPHTKTKDMISQIARGCPECAGELQHIPCEARTFHFVVEEDSSQYSVWEHSGTHHSHPRPPAGRRPPRSVPRPPKVGVRAKSLRPPLGASAAEDRVNTTEGLLNISVFPF